MRRASFKFKKVLSFLSLKKLGLQHICWHPKEVFLSSTHHTSLHASSIHPIHSKADLTWPEKLMAHGVDSGNVVRAHIAIINGWLWFSDPVGIVLVCMCSNFSQQLKFQWFGLIIPSGKDTKTNNICLGENTTKVRQGHSCRDHIWGSARTKSGVCFTLGRRSWLEK